MQEKKRSLCQDPCQCPCKGSGWIPSPSGGHSKCPTPQPIHCVVYSHRHGVDVYHAATEPLQQKIALELVQENRVKFDLPEDLSDREALSSWSEVTNGEENIELVSSTIICSYSHKLLS